MRKLNFRKKRRGERGLKIHIKQKFQIGKHTKRNMRTALIWIGQIALVCGIAFMLVWLFGHRVSNAGDSMKPALKNGNVVLVNRLVYNARKPKRGDIIAFRPNGNENAHYSIKRVVALPGESIQIKEGSVYIDGAEMTEHIYAKEIVDAGIVDEPMKLGEDEYFVIGDNHEGSDDSRMADVGNVNRKDIFGKAWFVTSIGEDFGFLKR